MSDKKKVICVLGPTASGKTELGIKIAEKLNGEIICADSMQIYKGMSVASAAPTEDERKRVPHHLAEFLNYDESFTVGEYVKSARAKIEELLKRGVTPVIVGGTGLYISSLADNIIFTEAQTDKELRGRLEKRMEEIGAEAMLEELCKLDSAAAEKLHPNNKRRIIRAFEIYETTGLTVTEQNRVSREKENPYEYVMLGINYKDRQKLYDRINLRVDKMVENGLVPEAQTAFKNQKGASDGAVQAIGHKELFPYFNGESSLEECIEKLKQSTRRYAKRQITWFSRDERIKWLYPDEDEDIFKRAINIISES